MDPEDFSKGSLRGEGVPRIIVFAGGSASYFLVNLLYYLIFEFFRAWGRGGGLLMCTSQDDDYHLIL